MPKQSTPEEVQNQQNEGERRAQEGRLFPGGSGVQETAFDKENAKIEHEKEDREKENKQ